MEGEKSFCSIKNISFTLFMIHKNSCVKEFDIKKSSSKKTVNMPNKNSWAWPRPFAS